MTKIFSILIIFIFLQGCQNIQDGLTLKKKSSSDEFLVKKKNPLVLPPEFSKLPTPGGELKKNQKTSSNEIKQLLKKGDNKNNISKAKSDSQKIEQNILNKIKNR